jgi:hypothetical protein
LIDGLRVIEGGNAVPGMRSRLEFTDQFPAASWRTLTVLTNNAMGQFRYVETAPEASPTGFYRVVYP